MTSTRAWALALVALLLLTVTATTSDAKGTPQFVPNGRYGRRSVTPPLAGVSRDLTVNFFGDSSISCSYTGFADMYRCSRKPAEDYKDTSFE
ncbi:RYamide neuropeptides-like [Haemaphysalis longicornis]